MLVDWGAPSGGSAGARQSRDFFEVDHCCVAASGLGEKVKRLIAVIADRHQRLIHVVL